MCELAELLWETSRNDEGSISATGANHIAKALLDAGYVHFPEGSVVLDPDDRAEVLRLLKVFNGTHANAHPAGIICNSILCETSRMQDALREFSTPRCSANVKVFGIWYKCDHSEGHDRTHLNTEIDVEWNS